MRYSIIIVTLAMLGCGETATNPGGNKSVSVVSVAGDQIPVADESYFLLTKVTWVYDPQTKAGSVTLVVTDPGRDTIATIQRGTLTNLHACTAGGFAQSFKGTIEQVFEDLGIPDTSSHCIESGW